MSRISPIIPENNMIEWIERNQKQIKNHSAWNPHISENECERLLKDKSPFTYILRAGKNENSYFISFIEKEGLIKHQFFILEFHRKGWHYRNGSTLNTPEEIISEELNELIPLMMHCDCKSCSPLHAIF